MCDFEIPPMERSEAEPPAERAVEQPREAALEAAVEQKAEQVAETTARERLDSATTEPRGFVEAQGDYKQAEDIQRDLTVVADNLAERVTEKPVDEGTGSEAGSGESATEGPGPLPEGEQGGEDAGEGIRLLGTDRRDRREETFVAENPWPDEGAEKQEETAAPPGLDGGGGSVGDSGEAATEGPSRPGMVTGDEEHLAGGGFGPVGEQTSQTARVAAFEAGAQDVASLRGGEALSQGMTADIAGHGLEQPGEGGARTGEAIGRPGEPENVPDTMLAAADEVMRRLDLAGQAGSGDSSSGDTDQEGGTSSTDSTSTSVDREGFVQGPGIPVVERFGMTYDQLVEDMMKYCKRAYDKTGGAPADEDPSHWVADRIADYFETRFGQNPEIVKLAGMLRQAGDLKTGQPYGKTIVTRVPPSDSDFIGPPGVKGPETAGTTTWGSKPGTTTPARPTTGGTMPGTPTGSTEKGGMREGTSSDYIIEPENAGEVEGDIGQTGQDVLEEMEEGRGEEEGGGRDEGTGPDDMGGLGPEESGGGSMPGGVDIEEPSDEEIEVEGEFEGEGEGEGEEGGESSQPGGGSGDGGAGGSGSGGTGGSGGSGGNGGSPGGEGDGGSGGGDDGGGDDDGDDDEGTTDSGGDEGGGEEEGMTVDGGSGSEPGRRQGSILGGTVPSGGGETQDAGRQGPILEGGVLGGGGGEGGGSDVGGKERLPIEGGTQVYPDSGGARPIDPKRATAEVKATTSTAKKTTAR